MTEVGVAFAESWISPYESFQSTGAIIYTTLASISAASCSILLLSMLLEPQKSTSMLMLGSILLTDWIYALTAIIFNTINIYHGGWATGSIGCVIFQVICITTCGSTIMMLLIVTIERYIAIFHDMRFTVRQTKTIICFVWMINLVAAFFPLYTNTVSHAVALEASKTTCIFTWHSTRPGLIIANALLTFGTVMPIIIMIIVYTRIILFYTGVKSGQKKNLAVLMKERKLVIKSVAIVGSFLICWLPYLCLILNSFVTGHAPSMIFDAITTNSVILGGFSNSLVLYHFDPSFKKNVNTMFGLQSLKPSNSVSAMKPNSLEVPVICNSKAKAAKIELTS